MSLAPLSDAQRNRRADGVLQVVLFGIKRRLDAIDIHPQALGLTGAVVGDEDMLEGLLLDHVGLGRNLQRVLRPLAHDVDAELLVALVKIPATMFLAHIHARDHAGIPRRLAHAHPRAVTEGVRLFEIACVAKIETHAFLQDQRRAELAFRPLLFARERNPARRPDRHREAVALAHIERGVQDEVGDVQLSVEVSTLRAGEPAIERGLRFGAPRRNLARRRSNFARQRGPARGVFRRLRHEDARGGVLRVAVLRGLRRVPEERLHRIEIFLRERIELVVVTRSAVQRCTEPDPTRRGDAVVGVVRLVLLVDGSALVRRRIAAMEARRRLLIRRRVIEQIPRELFQCELVELHVLVERLDHPVAIRPHLAVVVEVEPMRIGVTRGVEPVTPAMLAPRRRCHQSLHELLVVVRRLVLHERLD